MIVRIRLDLRSTQRAALALASLLTPAAVVGCVLALWRLTADFKATSEFPITSGLLSHWQVWLGGAAILQLCVIALNRYGKSERTI
jgi:hypothetical protein